MKRFRLNEIIYKIGVPGTYIVTKVVRIGGDTYVYKAQDERDGEADEVLITVENRDKWDSYAGD